MNIKNYILWSVIGLILHITHLVFIVLVISDACGTEGLTIGLSSLVLGEIALLFRDIQEKNDK